MAEPARRRLWMLVVGVLLLVGLLGLAVALWAAAGDRHADNVAGFARAPAGCDTTLDFESTGTFVLYVETTGELDQLPGACDAQLRYDRAPDDVPDVELTLRDLDGADVAFADTDEVGYDVDGFVGTSLHQVEIDTPGDHVLSVAPSDGEAFAIAVGRSPDEGVALLRGLAVAAAIAGLLFGGLLLVLGSRRPAAGAPAPAPWTPDGHGWPASPPGFPAPPPTTGAIGPAGPPIAPPPGSGSPNLPAPPQRPQGEVGQRSPWGPPSPPQ